MEPRHADERLITDQVRQFAQQTVHELALVPERPLEARQINAFLSAAEDMGLLDADAGGLWLSDTPEGCRQSVLSLLAIAEITPDLAFHLHHRALTARLLHALPESGLNLTDTTLSLSCGAGFPAEALAQWAVSENTIPTSLASWWLPRDGVSTLVIAPDGWQNVLLPAVTESGAGWMHLRRDDIPMPDAAPLHAPDGWSAWQGFCLGDTSRKVSGQVASAAYLHLLGTAWLGQLTIALGATRLAGGMARRYAGQRRQGGVLIQSHAAVQHLLADIDHAEQLTGQALASLCDVVGEAAGDVFWSDAATARGALHPLLWRAANAAMQVFGGIGYMKDTGIERLLRLQHVLGCLNGTSPDMDRLATCRRLAA